MGNAKRKGLLKDANVIDSRRENDTLKIWENYRDQALLWRALSLLQIPATFIALCFALMMYWGRQVILNVPAKPLPGMYTAQEIPDTEFIEVATNFVNLIASYQPAIAPRQFAEARRWIVEPFLTKFNEQMMKIELEAIRNSTRTQLYFPNPVRTKIKRGPNGVTVTLAGERVKLIAGQPLPGRMLRFRITMTTIPRHSLNPYGIVVKDVHSEEITE